MKNLYLFFIREELSAIKSFKPSFNSLSQKRIYLSIKLFTIGFILFDSLGMYIRTGNYNDDLAARPLFHGAYEVKNNANGWKRAFVHRRGYFIIQSEDEKMHDFKLEYDLENNNLILENEFTKKKYFYPYSAPDENTLILSKISKTDTLNIELIKMEISDLPLLQNEFHWTID